MVEQWWKRMWALWSIRLGALASIGIGWMAAYPDDWNQIVAQFPEGVRPLIGLLAFAAITWSRMSKRGASNAK